MNGLMRIVCLLYLLSFAALACMAGQDLDDGAGLLWRVQTDEARPSYVYGTMHVSDARVTRLAPAAQQAFAQADSLSLELTMDYTNMALIMQGMYLAAGRSLESVVGRDLYGMLLQAVRERGIPGEMIVNMKPWAVMTLLLYPRQAEAGVALDAQLYDRAIRQGKAVFGLETAAEQLAVFDNLPDEAQVQMLRSVLDMQGELEKLFEQMTRLYLAGDLHGLQRMSDAMMADYPVLAHAFNKVAIHDRNVRMVSRMQARLREGNAFVAVGALHLPGEKGILRLLQQQGYRVSPVR